MTLITKLTTSFSDTTLPKLRLDPLLTDAATPLLYDFKSSAGRNTSFNPSAPSFKNLGTYTTVGSITPSTANFPWSSTKGALTYASNTDNLTIALESYATSQIFNSTDNFVVILWASKRSADLGAFFYTNYLCKGAGNTGSGDQTLAFMHGGTTASFTGVRARVRLASSAGAAGDISTIGGPSIGGSPVQLAMSWRWTGTQWLATSYSNGVKDAGEITSASPLWLASSNLTFFGQTGGYGAKGSQVHRLLIENLTGSGRTAQDVVTLDYATNNGRFSS
jgi:hypothetical protein